MEQQIKVRINRDDSEMIDLFSPKTNTTAFALWGCIHTDSIPRVIRERLEDGEEVTR